MSMLKYIHLDLLDIQKMNQIGTSKRISFKIDLNVDLKPIEEIKNQRLASISKYQEMNKTMLSTINHQMNKLKKEDSLANLKYVLSEYSRFLKSNIEPAINKVLKEFEKNNQEGMNLYQYSKNISNHKRKQKQFIFSPTDFFKRELKKIYDLVDNIIEQSTNLANKIGNLEYISKKMFERLLEKIESGYQVYYELKNLKISDFKTYVTFEKNKFFIEFLGENNEYNHNWTNCSEYLKMLISKKIVNFYDQKGMVA